VNRNPELVFVYGTLQRGHVNHHWLAGCGFEGEGTMAGLVLHDLGPFPMAIPGDGEVRGEVYRLEAQTLDGLDRLEGYPRLYDRLPLPLGDGRWAWVYVGRPRQVRHVPAIPGGRWTGRRALVLMLPLLLLAAGLPGAWAGVPSCRAWQRATGEEKLRLGNALGAAHYLTRLHLDSPPAATNPEAPAVALYATSDLRRLCTDR
jgi:gamma-glutamylcyclotransferase (GGCT)/AIG2-like uncharacterized protein YtfP